MKRKRVLGLVLGLALVLSLCLTTVWAAASGTITFKTANNYEAGTPVTIRMEGIRDHVLDLYYRTVNYTIQRDDGVVVKSGNIVGGEFESSDFIYYSGFNETVYFTPDKVGTYTVTVSEPELRGILGIVHIDAKVLASEQFVATCTNCSGGTATCHSLAVCTKCGKEYGKLDPNNHDVSLYAKEVSAGCTTNGYHAIYWCENCNTFFADQNGEMPISVNLDVWKTTESSDVTLGGMIPAAGHTYRYSAVSDNQVTRYCTKCWKTETATLVVEGGPVENQRLAKLVRASGTDLVDVTEDWKLSIDYYLKDAFGRYQLLPESWLPTSGKFCAVIDLGTKACNDYTWQHRHNLSFTTWKADLWDPCQGRFAFVDFAYHTVFFNTNGGSEVSRQIVGDGQPIASVTDLTREGYTFAGWYTVDLFGETHDWEEGTPVTRDTILFAKWTPNDYPVTFVIDGVSTVTDLPYRSRIPAPETPIKEGHTFAGWFDAQGNLWTFDETCIVPLGGVTLTAHWIEDDCNVIFMSDGVVVGGQVVKFGQKASPTDVLASDTELASGTSIASDTDAHLNMLEISKTGYTFDGWYASETFEGDAWDFENDEVTVERLVLYAKWNINFYNVSYISDGITLDTIQASYSSLLQKPEDPQKDNFTFNGWWHKLLSDVKQTWNFDEDRVTDTLDLNAIWVPNSVKVTDDDYKDTQAGSGELSANFQVEGGIDGLLTEEDRGLIAAGNSIQFELVVKNDPETVAAMQGDIAQYGVSTYFVKYGNNIYPVDIDIFKNVYDAYGDKNDQYSGQIHSTLKPLTITLTVPEEMKTPVASGFARHYSVLRVHNGLVVELPATYNANGTLTFQSNLFSTYLIAYQDVATETGHHGGTYVPSGKTFHTTLDDILAVYVDGVKLDSKWYTISGSDVTLTQAFLDTLAVGKHHFRAESRTMYADADFYIYGNATTVVSAPTGDAGVVMYAVMSLTALSGASWCLRKKRNG